MSNKKSDIIQPTSKDMMEDRSLQSNIIQHVNAFGFCYVFDNIIEAYRSRARKFNKQADELEKVWKKINKDDI